MNLCIVCGAPFKPYLPHACYCSPLCKRKAKTTREREARHEKAIVGCIIPDDDTPSHVIEDIEWMVSTGEHPTRIARRVGRTVGAIEKMLRRAGRTDLTPPFQAEMRLLEEATS